MKKENLKSAADICKDNGLSKPAQLLKKLASGTVKGYMVIERDAEYGDDIFYLASATGRPENFHLSKASAMKAAKHANAMKLRRQSPFVFGFSAKDVLSVPVAEFEKKVSKILGTDFKVPTDEDLWDHDPVFRCYFPAEPSDEQLTKISKMIKVEFYEVVEVEMTQ